MLNDIFSGFDDSNQVLFGASYLVWGLVMLFCCWALVSYYGVASGAMGSVSAILSLVEGLVSRTEGKNVGGSVVAFSVLFFVLAFFNLSGLVPYVFSLTSHLAINLALAFPIWLSVILMSMSYDLGGFLSHLQPMGAPVALSPFLCVIELVSLLVRPLTLSVRLTANLSTGHILTSLLGVGFLGGGVWAGGLILLVGSFYFLFEMAVCLVQSYIFTLLPTLYLDEHPTFVGH